jgi:hypothetical protein
MYAGSRKLDLGISVEIAKKTKLRSSYLKLRSLL